MGLKMVISYITAKWQKFYLNYSVVTAIYMMEPWERVVINSIVIVMLATMLYSSWVYLPHYTIQMLGFLGVLELGPENNSCPASSTASATGTGSTCS